MSNPIPSGQNNPINYINNAIKMFTTIRDAASQITTDAKGNKTGGFISYQDWYNIANEMNRMAGKVGKDFEFAGVKLDGSLEAASKLVNKGIASFDIDTSTNELKVSLGKMSIDFEAGADAMGKNVDAGVKAIAEAEISMLDSMISVLETIVAMEKLGDIDVEGNGIDFNDLFKFEGYDEQGNIIRNMNEFSQGYEDARQYLLNKITKGNKEFNKELA